MKGKNLAILFVVAVVLVGLAVKQSKKPEGGGRTDAVGKPLVADLPLNDVERVVFAGAGSTATVERINGVWHTKELYGYPANFGKLKKLLIAMSELKIGQTVRLNEKDKDALKLRAPGAAASASAAGTEVRMQAGDGRVLASLLFGDSRKRKTDDPRMGGEGYPDGRYVSADGGANVYLIANDLYELSVQPKDWADAELLNVGNASVQKITVEHPGGAVLKFTKPEGGALTLDGLAGDEELDNSKAYGLESALSYLRFDGIAAPELTPEQMGLSTGVRFTVSTKEGEEYKVTVGGVAPGGAGRYVRMEASYSAPPEPAKDAKTEKPDEAGLAKTNAVTVDLAKPDAAGADKAAAERAEKIKAEQQKIAELNGKVKAWTYVINTAKSDILAVTRAQVVKKKEAPTEEPKEPAGEFDVDQAPAVVAPKVVPPAAPVSPAPAVPAPAAPAPAPAVEKDVKTGAVPAPGEPVKPAGEQKEAAAGGDKPAPADAAVQEKKAAQ